ncbi:MAG: hypothetical protein ACPLPR_06695 [Bacillota bacterium]
MPESKKLIAKAIAAMPEVRKAMVEGKVFLKGGTTTSAVSQELGGPPLRISGRISPTGARGAMKRSDAPHCLVFERGIPASADGRLEEVVGSLGPEDVAILGANLVDRDGKAGMLAGSLLGGPPGRVLSGLAAQGTKVIIACGLEKFFPGRIEEAIMASGRTKVDKAMGMAVGVIPLIGQVITEVEACSILSGVKATVVARGGIHGAEGGTTLVAEGNCEQVEALCSMLKLVKGAGTSGDPESMEECSLGRGNCAGRNGCRDFLGLWPQGQSGR